MQFNSLKKLATFTCYRLTWQALQRSIESGLVGKHPKLICYSNLLKQGSAKIESNNWIYQLEFGPSVDQTMANSIIVDIHLSSEQYLSYYQGVANTVQATSRDGRSIRFPASIIKPFLQHDGIHGAFEIYFDQNGKFSKINQITG